MPLITLMLDLSIFCLVPGTPLVFKPSFLSFTQIALKSSDSVVHHLHTDSEPGQCVFIFAIVFFSFIILFDSFLKLLFLCFYNCYFYF